MDLITQTITECPKCKGLSFSATVSSSMSCEGVENGRLVGWDFINGDPQEDVNVHVVFALRCENDDCDWET